MDLDSAAAALSFLLVLDWCCY